MAIILYLFIVLSLDMFRLGNKMYIYINFPVHVCFVSVLDATCPWCIGSWKRHNRCLWPFKNMQISLMFCKIFWGLSMRVQKHAHMFWGFYCTYVHTVRSEGGRCLNDTKKKELERNFKLYLWGVYEWQTVAFQKLPKGTWQAQLSLLWCWKGVTSTWS